MIAVLAVALTMSGPIERVTESAPRSPAQCFNAGGSEWFGHVTINGPMTLIAGYQFPADVHEVWAICVWSEPSGRITKISWDRKPLTAEELREPE